MTEYTAMLTAPLFWIASAVLSVVLSVVANLITPVVANLLGKFSGKRRKAREMHELENYMEVHRLYEDLTARTNAKLSAIYRLLKATVALATALLIIVALPFLPMLPRVAEVTIFFLAAVTIVRTAQWALEAKHRMKPALLADSRQDALREQILKYGSNNVDKEQVLRAWDEQNYPLLGRAGSESGSSGG